jgi:hypothetical protein
LRTGCGIGNSTVGCTGGFSSSVSFSERFGAD